MGEQVKTAHFGDPCISCGIGHDDIAPGRCPKNDGKLRVAHYVLISRRWDGYATYRFRTTDGRVHETVRHPSDHAPYYHFGHSDDLIQPPEWDASLRTAQVTA